MEDKKKEPLYKKVSSYIIAIGLIITFITVFCAIVDALIPSAKAVIGLIDYETMRAQNVPSNSHTIYYVFGAMAWWVGLMLSGLIELIGDRVTRFLSSS